MTRKSRPSACTRRSRVLPAMSRMPEMPKSDTFRLDAQGTSPADDERPLHDDADEGEREFSDRDRRDRE